MWEGQIRPLATEFWVPAMKSFSDWCENADAEAEDRAARRALQLAMIAPLGVRRLLQPSFRYDEIELLLEADSIEHAAQAILGGNVSIQATRSEETGLWRTQFSIDNDRPVCAEGRTAVLAMLGAWARYFS